jgi:hypothetical protein
VSTADFIERRLAMLEKVAVEAADYHAGACGRAACPSLWDHPQRCELATALASLENK